MYGSRGWGGRHPLAGEHVPTVAKPSRRCLAPSPEGDGLEDQAGAPLPELRASLNSDLEWDPLKRDRRRLGGERSATPRKRLPDGMQRPVEGVE